MKRWIGTMANIDELIDDVIEREGGYVNHPADRGGPTNCGITEAVARRQGYVGDMRALPRSDAAAIYKRLYWFKPRFDEVAMQAPALAAELFDTGINMGTGTATAFLQRALNALNREGRDFSDLAIDRQIGPATLAALKAFLRKRGAGGESVLLKAVEALQGAHYINIAEARPSQEAFVYGWLANRIG
ncbi:MAG TPA: glycosyl hydrolase 108 family protein [Sphingorhabdus sp.]|nr:glycosyl hydrolase 108 family protein [Sphingorhabdus sp.]